MFNKQHAQPVDAFSVAAIDDLSNVPNQKSELVAKPSSALKEMDFANEKLKIFRFDKFLMIWNRSSCHSDQDRAKLSIAKKNEFV